MSAFQAGIATVDVTPPVGTWLAGFAGRSKGSEGIHDPLRSRALVLDDGATRLALITNDIISVRYETIDELKSMIFDECGLQPEQVMINCSHTHSGPAMRPAGSVYSTDECYIRTYMRKIVGAVKMALSDLQPARLGMARTDVQIGINRRERTPEGGTKLGENPDLPVAPYVDVLRVDAMDGSPRVILMSHACHPVTRAADNYMISADYPGRAQACVETVFVGAQAMFAQGCSGNINTVPVGGSFEDVHRLGTVLGGAAIKAAAMIETQCDISLGSVFKASGIPLQDPPPVAEAAEHFEQAKQALQRAEQEGDPTQVRIRTTLANWTEKILELSQAGETGRVFRYDLQAFKVGDWAIVGLPGEVFCEYQLNIDAASPFHRTMVLGVTNGCPSYIPIASEFEHGGYEVVDSMRYYGETQLDPATEQVILSQTADLLKQLI